MALTSNSYVTKLDLIDVFQGDTVTIPFEWYYNDEKTEPINLLEMGVEVFWTLCPYGAYDYPVLRKRMIISEGQPNLTTVLLSLSDTQNLEDIKYSHQPILVYENTEQTREYRRAEGDMLIRPRIKHELISIKED